ncbi:MAG: MotA/TolQ/ExbB proton channel family protein [Oceanicoccus sp.]
MKQSTISIIVLISSAIVVHLLYSLWILPEAESLQAIAAETGSTLPRNVVIVLKDLEQELCLILMLWGGYLCISKMYTYSAHDYLFDVDILKSIEEKDESIPAILDDIDSLDKHIKESPLIQTLTLSLRRYLITNSVQSAAETIQPALDVLSIKNASELSVIKYITWAIPSIGFLGTVRGIGQAMAQAEVAIAGDIGPMTSSLGVAFNSTFVALLISILLMLLLSFIERMQDDNLVKIHSYCERYLIKRITLNKHNNV